MKRNGSVRKSRARHLRQLVGQEVTVIRSGGGGNGDNVTSRGTLHYEERPGNYGCYFQGEQIPARSVRSISVPAKTIEVRDDYLTGERL